MGINIAQGIKNYHFILNIYLIYPRSINHDHSLPVNFRSTFGLMGIRKFRVAWRMVG